MNRNVIGHKPVINDDGPERVIDKWSDNFGTGAGHIAGYSKCGYGYREHISYPGSADDKKAKNDYELFCGFFGVGWLVGGNFSITTSDRLSPNG